jgi:hypothetical protein
LVSASRSASTRRRPVRGGSGSRPRARSILPGVGRRSGHGSRAHRRTVGSPVGTSFLRK